MKSVFLLTMLGVAHAASDSNIGIFSFLYHQAPSTLLGCNGNGMETYISADVADCIALPTGASIHASCASDCASITVTSFQNADCTSPSGADFSMKTDTCTGGTSYSCGNVPNVGFYVLMTLCTVFVIVVGLRCIAASNSEEQNQPTTLELRNESLPNYESEAEVRPEHHTEEPAQSQTSKPKAQEQRYCASCGAAIKVKAKFCVACGSAIDSSHA